ncbi:MAG TPA: GNAT family protein [Caulobacteraceae bacterium]|jgi:RimJ/RimL family protein N-acetyltransferase|nr:GNAT family protein [Caulobacteraceae bacterium]
MAERALADDLTLEAPRVRLEPLGLRHVDGLVAAAAEDPSLYAWSYIPQGREAMNAYVEAAVELRSRGLALPLATVRRSDGALVGSTRFFDFDRWPWPQDHPRRGGPMDGVEIGYTWLSGSAVRTAINTEAKLLMLTHAFETWRVVRVCLHTDARNDRSAKAMERIGAKFEGVLRAHRFAVDHTPRDSKRFSIVAEEWPMVKARLAAKLEPW